MVSPLRSNRPRISPSRPRRTASGLTSTSVRSTGVLDTESLRDMAVDRNRPSTRRTGRARPAYVPRSGDDTVHASLSVSAVAGCRPPWNPFTFLRPGRLGPSPGRAPQPSLAGRLRRSTVVNPGRRSVAPVRKLVAAVLGTIAVFVMLFGLGMTSWPIVALGAAMLVLAIGLALINVVRRGGRAWVAGTAHVVSVSEPPASSVSTAAASCSSSSRPPACRRPGSRSATPGYRWRSGRTPASTLPVMVAVDDMRHVRIQWDEVMTHTEAMEEPQMYADPMRDLGVDDLLPEPEAPPWVTRDRQQRPRGGGATRTRSPPTSPGSSVTCENAPRRSARQPRSRSCWKAPSSTRKPARRRCRAARSPALPPGHRRRAPTPADRRRDVHVRRPVPVHVRRPVDRRRTVDCPGLCCGGCRSYELGCRCHDGYGPGARRGRGGARSPSRRQPSARERS